jgi:hypothetical protein
MRKLILFVVLVLAAVAVFSVAQNPPGGYGPGAGGSSFPVTTAVTVNSPGSISVGAGATISAVSGGTITATNGPFSAGLLDPTQAPYNVKVGVVYGFDMTTSGGSNVVTSTAQSCSASQTGYIIASYSPGFASFQLANNPPTTVTGCSGASWTTSVNATGGAGIGSQTFMIFPPGNGAALASAYAAANAANQQLALPCGSAIGITTIPFPALTNQDEVNQSQDLNGCNTHFVLHPNITQTLLGTGGVFFATWNPTQKTGTLGGGGIGGQCKIQDMFLTSLGMPLIGAVGKGMTAISGFLGVVNIAMQSISLSAGQLIGNSTGTGEAHFHKLNYQNFCAFGGCASASYIGVSLSGQGTNLVDDSIFAFTPLTGINCNNANCSSVNNYFASISTGLTCVAGPCNLIYINNTCGTLSGSGAQGCLTDGGNVSTIFAFGNVLNSGSPNFQTIQIANAASVLDISGTIATATTSGWSILGIGTVNERRGNTFTGPLTQFTGTFALVEQGICTNTTPVTVSANVATDQNLMTCAIPANFLYTPGVTLSIWLSGVYSTPAASTTAVVVKAKLGTLTLATWTSTALAGIQATNDQFNVEAHFTVVTAGTTAVFEAHGNMVIDLGVGNTVADSTFADVNTATVSPIDLTAAQTLQITIAFTVASASNSATQRQLKAQIW